MQYWPLLLFVAVAWGQPRQVIVLPAGHRQASVLDLESWQVLGRPLVGLDSYQAFSLPDGSKTYVISRQKDLTVTVLGDLAAGGPQLKSLDLPAGSTDAVLTPDGRRLLIASLRDAALTVINTASDRVIARIPLPAPANSVAVNFDATVAYVALPEASAILPIDLDRYQPLTLFPVPQPPLQGRLQPDSQLTFAPNGLLYLAAGGFLHEIDPRRMTLVAAAVATRGVRGRPLFTFEGVQTLLVNTEPPALTLSGVRGFASPGSSFAQPGVALDQVRIVSETLAIGYSPANRLFYRIALQPTLEVAPLPNLRALATDPVGGLGGTGESPQNRYLFIASGDRVHRLNLATNELQASEPLGGPAGLPLAPSRPGRPPAASVHLIGPTVQKFGKQGTLFPLVFRALNADGLPVSGQGLATYVSVGGWQGGERELMTNAQGYVQSLETLPEFAYADDYPSGLTAGVYLDGPPFTYSFHSPSSGFQRRLENFQLESIAGGRYDRQPTNLSIYSGNGQLIPDGDREPRVIQVRVSDSFGVIGFANLPVAWSVTGGGALQQNVTFTDARGIATNVFRGPALPAAADRPARFEVQATGAGLVPAQLTLSSLPASTLPLARFSGASRLKPLGPLSLTGIAGTTHPDALSYRLVDAAGRPLAGVGLEVRPVAGSASVRCLSPWNFPPTGLLRAPFPTVELPVTGADGVVTCLPSFGPAAGRGQAQVLLGGQPVDDVHVSVQPGAPARVSMVSGHQQRGEPGQTLAHPLVAMVTDAVGNPVNGALVTWTAGAGAEIVSAVSISQPDTFSDPLHPALSNRRDGLVTARLRVVQPTPVTGFRVSLGDLVYTGATLFVNEAPLLTKLDGDGQSAPAGSDFLRPLVVRQLFSDLLGTRPLPGLPVKFTASGGLKLSSAVAPSDITGRAEVSVLAGSVPGSYTVTAAAGEATATFRLTVTGRPGPVLHTVVNEASRLPGLAPCSLGHLLGSNLTPDGTLTLGGLVAPVLRSSGETRTFQVPCELTPGPATLRLATATGSATLAVNLVPFAPALFTAAGRVVAFHADGEPISPGGRPTLAKRSISG